MPAASKGLPAARVSGGRARGGVVLFDAVEGGGEEDVATSAPAFPDDPQATVFPFISVIVIVVLLNVALTCATPSASITRFDFLPVAMSTQRKQETGSRKQERKSAPFRIYFVTFFLPAMARRGPFLVRALV
jgi:hypothetical protein